MNSAAAAPIAVAHGEVYFRSSAAYLRRKWVSGEVLVYGSVHIVKVRTSHHTPARPTRLSSVAAMPC